MSATYIHKEYLRHLHTFTAAVVQALVHGIPHLRLEDDLDTISLLLTARIPRIEEYSNYPETVGP